MTKHTHTNKSMHSEWTQWHEAKSGRPKLWAAQVIVTIQRHTILLTTTNCCSIRSRYQTNLSSDAAK